MLYIYAYTHAFIHAYINAYIHIQCFWLGLVPPPPIIRGGQNPPHLMGPATFCVGHNARACAESSR